MTLGRRFVAAALAALAAGAVWTAVQPGPTPAAPAALARPLWSPERLPALLAEAQGTVDLERAVDAILPARSCLVVHEGGRPVLVRRPDLALVPASTQKLLVGVAAMHLLGADFRFETKLVAAAPRAGVVGTVWLVGSGDPFLATPEYAAHRAGEPRSRLRQATPLAALAGQLAGSGVRAVGDVRGDDSRYDRTRLVPTWKPSYITANEVGPLGALVVNSGFSMFTPSLRRAEDPAAHAAAELARLLGAGGVTVHGTPASGTAPAGTVTLASVRSRPLSEVVATMVRESDNTAAELVVRELGRQGAGEGSTAAGLAVVVSQLAEMGLAVEGLRLGDGSGLEVTNQATCGLLGETLRTVAGTRDLLAVAGRSGTLVRRLVDTPLEGKLFGKTGSLRGVTGLAGFVDGRRQLSFALLANGDLSESEGRLLQDRVVALLASYPGPQPVS